MPLRLLQDRVDEELQSLLAQADVVGLREHTDRRSLVPENLEMVLQQRVRLPDVESAILEGPELVGAGRRRAG